MKYRVYYYINRQNKKTPAKEYIQKLTFKERVKVFKFITFLQKNDGYLDEPYSRHITRKIRELRVDFPKTSTEFYIYRQKIILLHAFLKKSAKTPKEEIKKVKNNYQDFIFSQKLKGYD